MRERDELDIAVKAVRELENGIRDNVELIEMGEAEARYQPTVTRFYLYLPNVEAAYQRAINAGAISIMPPKDQPYGERVAGVKDAFGNEWFMARPVEGRG